MVIKLSKLAFLTTLLSFSALTAKAEIVQEITEGCSKDPIVSTMCITLSPFYSTTIFSVVPSEWSGTAWGAKSKVVYQAKNDAATFVATDGNIKGGYLEAAFILLRNENNYYKQIDDLSLAEAILVFNQKAPDSLK